MPKITYVLYGFAERDRRELVCQFFDTHDGMMEFVSDLPGTYDSMKLYGVALEDFEPYAPMVVTS